MRSNMFDLGRAGMSRKRVAAATLATSAPGGDPGRRPTPTYVLALLLLERMPACFCMLTPNAGVLKTVSAHHARGLRLTFFRPKEIAMGSACVIVVSPLCLC